MHPGEALKVEAQVWGREPAATSCAPLSVCSKAWYRWVHSSHARGLRAAHLVSTSVRVWVCVHIQKGKGRGLGVCLFTGDTVRHPPRCSRSRREQDALTLTYTFGAWKPQ